VPVIPLLDFSSKYTIDIYFVFYFFLGKYTPEHWLHFRAWSRLRKKKRASVVSAAIAITLAAMGVGTEQVMINSMRIQIVATNANARMSKLIQSIL